MKQTITSNLTVPKATIDGDEGYMYLQIHINAIAEDLKEEYGYASVEYVKYEPNDVKESADHFNFTIYYEEE